MAGIDIYTGQAERFARFALESYTWQYIERPALYETILPLLSPTSCVLDVGCGTGRIMQFLLMGDGETSSANRPR
jgi:ubiquinone/menaquinone biosynthesis C-methylase UbiE